VEAGHRRLATAGLEALVGAHWRGCSNGRPGEEADELSSLLLAPVAGMLEECRRVVVVPFGALAAVPFHALPFRGRALGEEHVVSFLPAGSLLAGRRLDDPIADGAPLLAVGDPAFDRTAQPSLPRLPGAAVEARAVGRVWGSQDVLVDEEATEPELRRLLPGRAVVHLAAHGQLDEISPSNSGLVLAGTDRLTVSDLIGLQLDGDLAVLSACDSGRGTVTLGGDVIGLTRGLLAGGVRRAVVSLWPVDDLTACATMVAFHERLLATAAPAQALAEAQADIRGLSGSELAARYAEAGGKSVPGIQTVRRASGTPLTTRSGASRAIPLDPSFVETLEPETEPVDALDGGLERVWAPFVLVGP
jgi:CHAT domain-containing protein